jgi:hypothetical protein
LKSFISIEGKLLHRLNQLYNEKSYCIRIGEKRYHYSETQIFFLSLETVEHFKKSKEDFVFDLNHSHIHSIQGINDCFLQINSLFSSTTEIILIQQNASTFLILADILDNPFLASKWQEVTYAQTQKFMLSSKNLVILPKISRVIEKLFFN